MGFQNNFAPKLKKVTKLVRFGGVWVMVEKGVPSSLGSRCQRVHMPHLKLRGWMVCEEMVVEGNVVFLLLVVGDSSGEGDEGGIGMNVKGVAVQR
jgi:hypothetical protein